jgi:hypothetical protein
MNKCALTTNDDALNALTQANIHEIAHRLFTPSQLNRFLDEKDILDEEMLRAAVIKRLKYAPDDTGREWKHPLLWTHEEIHQQVVDEIGCDDIAVRGFNVLVKLWLPDEMTSSGTKRSEVERRKEMQMCRIGKVLRMGMEAFTDRARFPFGHRITYGEWATFRGMEKDKYQKNGIMLAAIHDDRFIISDKNPETLQTAFDLERDGFGQ